jgi:hypothetical protein
MARREPDNYLSFLDVFGSPSGNRDGVGGAGFRRVRVLAPIGEKSLAAIAQQRRLTMRNVRETLAHLWRETLVGRFAAHESKTNRE